MKDRIPNSEACLHVWGSLGGQLVPVLYLYRAKSYIQANNNQHICCQLKSETTCFRIINIEKLHSFETSESYP